METQRQPDSPSRRDPDFEVTFDSAGVAVSKSRSRTPKGARIAWTEVMRVTAFKRDLSTFDCICLFLSGTDDNGIEFDEEMKGWPDLCDALPRFLPGCQPFHEWFRLVAHPSFATNPTEIYTRPTTGNT